MIIIIVEKDSGFVATVEVEEHGIKTQYHGAGATAPEALFRLASSYLDHKGFRLHFSGLTQVENDDA